MTDAVAHRWISTPIGRYLVAARPDALVGVWREEQSHFPAGARRSALGAERTGPHPVLDAAEAQLREYLAGERTAFDLPLDPAGTPFQHAVWERLAAIPRGTTVTYGTIAQDIGRPRAAQAVGAAVGANPISIIVPCHRVLGASGSLTGYAGGIATKQALLLLEGAQER
ncbi:methylated-DNA--[protein]-cysteine S-methyltransferase [Brachybacterium sp. DNPG3]